MQQKRCDMAIRYSFKNPEMIIAGSALIVSLITAFVSIYSAFIDRAYARSSVWPRIEIARGHDSKSYFRYLVSNNGTGPALIQYARVTYNGEAIPNWQTLFAKYGIANEGMAQSHIGTTVLPAQKQINPVEINNAAFYSKHYSQDHLISIELCYCSIYNECWLVDRENQPQPVAQCSIDDSQRFLQ